MDQVWKILIGIAGVITAAFIISLIIELRRTARALNDFLRDTEESLKPTLEELRETLKGLKDITNHVNDVTSDLKTLSSALRDVGIKVKNTSEVIEHVVSSSAVKVSGVKAGIKAGVGVLLKNLISKERR